VTNDAGLITLSNRIGIKAQDISELPIPDEDRQVSLAFESVEGAKAADTDASATP
jgi:hypothetical protein